MKETILASQARGSQPDAEESDIDFAALIRTVLGIVKQDFLLIAGIVAGVVVLGIVATMLIPPKYQSSAKIVIEDQAEQIIEGSSLQQAVNANETDRFLQTQLSVIQSRSLAKFIVEGAKLDRDATFFEDLGSEMPQEGDFPNKKLGDARKDVAIDLLLEALSVSIPVDSRIANISITSLSPRRSADLANLYAQRYIEYNLNQKYESSSYARNFLSNQLEQTRAKLTQSEIELNQYARAAGLIRTNGSDSNGVQDTALSVTNNQLIELNSAAAAATAERIKAEDRWRTLAGQPPLSIPEVTSNSAVMQLVTAKASAEAELADELVTHKEGFASVKAKRAQIAELDKRIQAIANAVKRSAELNYKAALENENSLRENVAALRDSALDEQDRGIQYSILKREADTNRALYESLLSRFNQLNASAGAASNNVAIVDSAVPSSIPSSPKLLLNIFIAFTLGILLAAAVVALKRMLDDAISSPEDVEKKLKLPLLGLIPQKGQDEIVEELQNRRSNLSEAYRSLVTNLTYSTANGLPQVLLVTSTREGEGKSTSIRAIATDIAQRGNRTLLIDVDLRRPTLHSYANLGSSGGLTDVITGQASLESVIHPSQDQANLDFLTALPMPLDPGLMLASERVGEIIRTARSKYDVVLLDAPPLLGLSDVPLLAKHADGILFVIDGSSFHRGAIKSALRRLELIDARILGVLLNRFNPKSGSNQYRYYSSSYYNYGNGDS